MSFGRPLATEPRNGMRTGGVVGGCVMRVRPATRVPRVV
jgi:hypothetical protein